ncbi:hypothetical protein [Liquorilactobacillus satsumensis]|nr:hypothetical protein [Liquorilactobacillus satsumensis]MCC7665996.1 hypothetical protein [Liquorilactobacillus satsumensis]MCP9327870.1 hypothetical protein [Liquorilactobacillus satsumensis]MCP9356702.1 hypothetical protein [Liquorilactobacillus satsumensis]MCP9370642.1 hypothetical protein [Liquorilactobacillus satsumensis]
MNKFLNMVVGGLGLLYVLNDTYFRIMIKLYRQQGYSIQTAEKIANIADIFNLIITLTIFLVIFGTLAVFSNMIYFMQGGFIFKIFFNCVTMLMPFLYVNNLWFILYELFFCLLFWNYLRLLKKSELDLHREHVFSRHQRDNT